MAILADGFSDLGDFGLHGFHRSALARRLALAVLAPALRKKLVRDLDEASFIALLVGITNLLRLWARDISFVESHNFLLVKLPPSYSKVQGFLYRLGLDSLGLRAVELGFLDQLVVGLVFDQLVALESRVVSPEVADSLEPVSAVAVEAKIPAQG
jgi:hypothetical protein